MKFNLIPALTLMSISIGGVTQSYAQYGSWTMASPMHIGRALPAAALLPDGRVLMAGGEGDSSTVEIFDPRSNTWRLAHPMSRPRAQMPAVVFPDGRVFVSGGTLAPTLTEIYDPYSDTWRTAAPMLQGRWYHTATLLPDGRVLVIGGLISSGGQPTAKVEIYDPRSNTWQRLADMPRARRSATAILLPDFRVLVIGDDPAPAIYDPRSNTWTSCPPSPLGIGRIWNTATMLNDGSILIAGGDGNRDTRMAEIFNPFTYSWSLAGQLVLNRFAHRAARLPDGKVMIVGGATLGSSPQAIPLTEVFDPLTRTWSAGPSLPEPRKSASLVQFPNGQMLLAGGTDFHGYPTSTFLYTPEPGGPRRILSILRKCGRPQRPRPEWRE